MIRVSNAYKYLDIMKFMNDYGFIVPNDSLGTYHSSPVNHQPQEMDKKEQQSVDETEGEAPSDVPFFLSEASLVIRNWRCQNLVGLGHHDVITCEIDLHDCINPLQPCH